MMDNRMFNINGQGSEMLLNVLKLAFVQSRWDKAEGFVSTKEHGLILLAYGDIMGRFPAPLSPEDVLAVVERWLASDDALEVHLEGDERDLDHDGHNTIGWRAYCERWGKVGNFDGAIVAIKPCHLWHGK